VWFRGPGARWDEAAVEVVWREILVVGVEFKVIIEGYTTLYIAVCCKCGVNLYILWGGYKTES